MNKRIRKKRRKILREETDIFQFLSLTKLKKLYYIEN